MRCSTVTLCGSHRVDLVSKVRTLYLNNLFENLFKYFYYWHLISSNHFFISALEWVNFFVFGWLILKPIAPITRKSSFVMVLFCTSFCDNGMLQLLWTRDVNTVSHWHTGWLQMCHFDFNIFIPPVHPSKEVATHLMLYASKFAFL